ncbi:MAG: four-carbon acid sugar kinase family protein [Verrucomicrobiales bacterium]|nr:four-carbon acid sugar kinase family protein [Verrucomicrobiales bacterium]
MEVVLADDFTGAAEIAGIAWRGHRSVALCLELPDELSCDVTVIDTDTRLAKPEEAREQVTWIAAAIHDRGITRVYKKIDSVLRGPVVAEIEGVLQGLKREQALLISANPSRGRIIAEGIYRIDEVLLVDTVFAHDPFHPALDSRVRERIGATERIATPDVRTRQEIAAELATLTEEVLPVGAGEFYEVWSGVTGERVARTPDGKQLWMGGSQAIRPERNRLFRETGIPVIEGCQSRDIDDCVGRILEAYTGADRVALEVPEDLKIDAASVLDRMARIGEAVLSQLPIPVVCLEGGATARSLIDRVGEGPFRVTGEWAPGVVGLKSEVGGDPVEWIVKPGSYPWPPSLFD